ncbi:HdeD family acid-resistance protein [Hamadaea tsunoensis]|uniref:HdeD family acid-resistance protein n=1 Tax=Hamadaea tsunoensis TaxID=53368 RepID=UPI000415E01C|nr:DUF308 domain-containing protein [Hamadaea tsunoensis]
MTSPAAQPRTSMMDTWRSTGVTGGITSIILGLVLLVWPGQTLLVFASLLAIGLILLGLVRLVGAFTSKGVTGKARAWRGLTGAVYLIAGILVLFNLGKSVKFLVILVGILWVISGLSEMISGFGRPAGDKAPTIFIGLLNLVFGVIILVWPGPTLVFAIWMAALWLIMVGLLQLWFAWRLSKL